MKTYHIVTRDGMDEIQADHFFTDGKWIIFRKEGVDVRAYSAYSIIKAFEV